MGREMKTSVLLGVFLLASLSLSRDVRLHLSLPEGSKLLSVDPGSETVMMDQDYSITDQDYLTTECKTDADCHGSRPEEHGQCRNGKCSFFMYGWFGVFLH